MKNGFLTLLLVCISTMGFAQRLEWRAGMYHFFDNTEFEGSSYTNDQTMAGVRFAPELGWRLNSTSRFDVGLDALKSYGSPNFTDQVVPIAYYLYNSKRFRFQMGTFPRTGLLDDFSRAFFQDSIAFYRPIINGFLFATQNRNFNAKAFLDWTGKEDSTVHESFFVGGSLKYRKRIFVAELQALMTHYAGSLTQRGVRDNMLIHPAVGVEFRKRGFVNAFSLSLGWLGGAERNRNLTDQFTLRSGALVEMNVLMHRLGIQTSSYWGQGIMVDYAQMGSKLYWGDPFYRGQSYHRVDVSYQFITSAFAKAKLNFANHFSEGRYYTEQSLTVQLALHSN